MNRKVPGPLFLLLFLGSPVLPLVSCFVAPEGRGGNATLLLGAAAACALVGHTITAVGNIPLNNALDSSRERGDERAARTAFEGRWRTLNTVRTLFATGAFVLTALACVVG
ncbi:anthrone oxygenase family protein [Streptomyces sp. NPDC048202]|uniref:anthrone oxygenase family protein n=1 Tax=unclassified Streptomyces TaxID=2593676 RepID=UPI00371D2C48